jgi:hypothetical protein
MKGGVIMALEIAIDAFNINELNRGCLIDTITWFSGEDEIARVDYCTRTYEYPYLEPEKYQPQKKIIGSGDWILEIRHGPRHPGVHGARLDEAQKLKPVQIKKTDIAKVRIAANRLYFDLKPPAGGDKAGADFPAKLPAESSAEDSVEGSVEIRPDCIRIEFMFKQFRTQRERQWKK